MVLGIAQDHMTLSITPTLGHFTVEGIGFAHGYFLARLAE